MPVLKIKKDGVWEEVGGFSSMNGGNADTLGGKTSEYFENAINANSNQNAFSNVKVGTTTIAADSTTDTLTLVAGNNVTLTPDATNDQITISAASTTYTHPSSGITQGTYNRVTVNAQGHVTAGENPTTLAGYGITNGVTNTVFNSFAVSVTNELAHKAASDHVHPAQTNITGNAATATKATQDGNGNVITSTYATMAYVKNQISSAMSNISSGKTLTEHLAEEDIILVEGKHFGDTLPPSGIRGRIFLLKKVTE